jgi:death-on-curing protein
MNAGPKWLTVEVVEDIHSEQLAQFGGPEGCRDRGLLESAVLRPQNKWAYEGSDRAELAAAFATLMVFLRWNGVAFAPPSAEATAVILSLAAGEISEEGLARWIRDNFRRV